MTTTRLTMRRVLKFVWAGILAVTLLLKGSSGAQLPDWQNLDDNQLAVVDEPVDILPRLLPVYNYIQKTKRTRIPIPKGRACPPGFPRRRCGHGGLMGVWLRLLDERSA